MKRSSLRSGLFLAGVVLLYVLLFSFAAPYVNGSDQFWHNTYIEAIREGKTSSGEIYPGTILRDGWDGSLPGFFHNTPILYLWALFSCLTPHNPYLGAIFCNLFLSLLAAFCLRHLLLVRTNTFAANASFVLALFFPLCFFQSVQLLTELSAMAFLVFALWLADRKTWWTDVLCALCLVTCVLTRKNLVLLAAAVLLLMFLSVWKRERRASRLFAFAAPVSFCVFYLTLSPLFATKIANSFSRGTLEGIYVQLTALRGDTMAKMFYAEKVDFTLLDLVRAACSKLWYTLKVQFRITPASVLFIFTNCLALLSLVGTLLLLKKKETRKKGFVCLFLLATVFVSFLATVVLMQNQVRYQLVFIPIFLLVCLFSFFEVGLLYRRVFRVFGILFVCLCLCVSGVLAVKSHMDAVSDHERFVAYQAELSEAVEEEANLVMMDADLLLSQAAYPHVRTMLSSRYDYPEEEKERMLLGAFYENEYLVTHAGAEISPYFSDLAQEHFTLCFEGEEITVYSRVD